MFVLRSYGTDPSSFMYDGERLQDDKYPLDYDMEDGDQIDCHVNPSESDLSVVADVRRLH